MTVVDPNPTTTTNWESINSALALGPNGDDVNSKVPFPMRDWLHVPTARYHDREFFELEKELLWKHVWQMAAREEEIPEAGDFVEYEINDQSVLIVRQRDGSIKAMHNTCRHRGNQLGKGCGRFPGGQIVCSFHGWRWGIDGEISHVFGREGFNKDTIQADELALREVLVETWAGHIWINLDREAGPLREALFPAADILEAVGVGNMRVKWWKETIINANWKLVQEAFFEGWHVKQTHPQLFTGDIASEENDQAVDYTPFVNGHGRFQSGDARSSYGGAMDFLESAKTLQVGQDAMTLERDITIFESVRAELEPTDPMFPLKAIQALYAHAAGAKIPMPEMTMEVMKMWGGDIHMFPNYLMLPMYGNALCYRVRPHNDDPNQCRFEIWSLQTYPEGEEPGRVELTGRYDKDDADNWGLIPRQDIANLEKMQQGLKSESMPELLLSELWECTIANMHHELDRRLAARIDTK